MSLLSEAIAGALFGTALLISGVAEPHIIKAQMLFTHSHMLQVFLGGSATSAIVFHLAHRTGFMRKKHRPPSNLGLFSYDGNVLGGALIGLGMAITGACPGTSLVQLGMGMQNGVLVVIGGILGAAVFLKIRPLLQGGYEVTSNPPVDPSSWDGRPSAPPSKSLDIPTALSIPPLGMLLLWLPMCLAVIVMAHRIDQPHFPVPAAGLPSPAYGGLLIGVAQAATVLLTRHHIGASTAYEDLARWTAQKLSLRQTNGAASDPALMTPSTSFAAGIVLSVAILKQFVLGRQLATTETSTASLPSSVRTIAGGASMVFGARLAGGCTSGHGISGLSKFSLSSLATTSAIFTGGVLFARVLGS